MVPDSLFRKPETQAHLQHRGSLTSTQESVTSSNTQLPTFNSEARKKCNLNMDVTISQVSERTPIQTKGRVTVFRSWLNSWYVKAARRRKYILTAERKKTLNKLVNHMHPTIRLPVLERTTSLEKSTSKLKRTTVPRTRRSQTFNSSRYDILDHRDTSEHKTKKCECQKLRTRSLHVKQSPGPGFQESTVQQGWHHLFL